MVNIIKEEISNSILNNESLTSDKKFEKYQSENLFLLIGTNPLPNYVAFKLLSKPSTHIFLVHTNETNQVANKLKDVMNLSPDRFTKIIVKETNAEDIYNKISEFAKGNSNIGLNYTGGTKSMAVHSYRAIKAADPDAIFSYLNYRNLELLFERQDISRSETVDLFPKPSLKELLSLHGYTPKADKFTTKPYKPDFLLDMKRIPCKELRSWCDENLRCGEGTSIRKPKYLKSVELPFYPPFEKLAIHYTDCKTLEDLEKKWIWTGGIKELAIWLDGRWLEDYTLWALQQNKTSCNIHEEVLGLRIEERKDFELDIAALKGYQLFAISCSTDSKKGMLKLKLFEAYVRAHQLGGDEAKMGLVCCAPSEKCDHQSNPIMIKKEIEEEWDVKDKIRVFGAEHLPDLSKHLAEWFNSQ